MLVEHILSTSRPCGPHIALSLQDYEEALCPLLRVTPLLARVIEPPEYELKQSVLGAGVGGSRNSRFF